MIRTRLIYPQANEKSEHFNCTLSNTLGTLSPEQKDWKAYTITLVLAYNCTKNLATRCSPHFLLWAREPRLPIEVGFGLQISSQKLPPDKCHYVEHLRKNSSIATTELRCWHLNYKNFEVGHIVMVRQTTWKGRHKIQERWEDEDCRVIGHTTPGVPAYVVQALDSRRSWILHRILLLPLQGKLRQDGRWEEEDTSVTLKMMRLLMCHMYQYILR